MPRRWKDRNIQKVALVRPANPEQSEFEINISTGTGSEVNVTNPVLTVASAGMVPVADRLTLESTQLAVRTAVEAIQGRADFPLPPAQVTALTPPATVAVSNMIPAVETGLAKDATVATRASESTLGLVRSALETIRDTILRRTDPLPAGQNIIGYTGNATIFDLEYGRIFGAGASLTTSVTTPNASLTVTNPAGSGKVLYVIAWSVYANATAEVRYILDATSTGTLVVPENLNIGLNAGATPVNSAMEVRVGAGVLTGGRQMNIAHQVTTQAPVEKDVLVKLPAGRSLTVRFLGPGATNTVDINAQWIERTG